MSKELAIEYVNLADIATWPRNPKTHNTPGIRASMKRFGFCDPMAVDEGTLQLVEGHGRLEVLLDMHAKKQKPPSNVRVDKETGDWFVPVLRGLAFKNEAEAQAYLLAHNRLTELGGWDNEALLSMLNVPDINLTGVGFSPEDVSKLLQDVMGSQPAESEPAEDQTYMLEHQPQVIVTCDNEAHQRKVIAHAQEQGWKFKVVV